jgi:hypothetical protein
MMNKNINKLMIFIISLLIILIIIYLFYYKNNINDINDITSIQQKFKIESNPINKPYLWQYWEGPKPEYIKLCMESVDKNCVNFNIIRLDSNNISEYLPELKQENSKLLKQIKKLIIPHQVDIFRIMLLYKYGGIYLDADVIVLRNPIEIINKLSEYDFVGFGCTGNQCKNGYGYPSNWILASKSDTKLMVRILKNLLDKINSDKNFEYHDLGKLIIWEELNKLINNENYKYYHYPNTIDGTRDISGTWVDSDRIFSNEKINYDNEDNLMFMIIYNSEVNDDIKKMTRDELLMQDFNYTKFIKRALNF